MPVLRVKGSDTRLALKMAIREVLKQSNPEA